MPLEYIARPSPEYEVYRQQREDKQFDEVHARLSQLQYEALLAQKEVERLESEINTFAFPENLRLGYAALGYLAIVGIVIPIALLPSDESSEPYPWVTWLFATGLVVVLVFIGVQIWGLLKKK
jgi:hypothetical protein